MSQNKRASPPATLTPMGCLEECGRAPEYQCSYGCPAMLCADCLAEHENKHFETEQNTKLPIKPIRFTKR